MKTKFSKAKWAAIFTLILIIVSAGVLTLFSLLKPESLEPTPKPTECPSPEPATPPLPDPTNEPAPSTPSPAPAPEPTPAPSPIPIPQPAPTPSPEPLPPPPPSTAPTSIGNVEVDGQLFSFNPLQVETIRPDLFNPGFFSMFDVLVHLNAQDQITLEYHFDESMNTHIIDSINGEPLWWYRTYYSGGWLENNLFRPDHYPWKDGTTLIFFRSSPSTLEPIHSVWKEEVRRKQQNNGIVIIPQVIIRGRTFIQIIKNVVVTPHNLRNDVFNSDIITAIDVILSLGDQGKITYELQWFESIGSASIVKDYWVEAINQDKASGRCGFVYEAGSLEYAFFKGNHIHLPSDSRILNSPDYVEFFWICI